MRNIRRSLSLPVLAAVVFLITGANDQVMAGVASRVTTSVTSKVTGSTTSGGVGRVSSSATTSMSSRPTSSVTSRLTSSATISITSKPTFTSGTLSTNAEDLAKAIKFDRRVLLIVKEETQDHIQRLIGYDEEDYQIVADGIAVSVPEDKTDRVLALLRKKLFPLKYLPFVVEMNEGIKTDKIGVLKGTDQYEILRVMHTDGGEYDVSNDDVIERLKEWEKTSSFDIIGAESDWVELEFKTLPKDLHAFVEEVYEFCPDAVDQGPGSVEGLIKEIRRTNRLFLSWY